MAAVAPVLSEEADLPRLVSYNVHICIGTDGVCSPERIAEVIAALSPDVVTLQELDVGRLRTGGTDQAETIAGRLSMGSHFHAAMRVEQEQYGDAVLAYGSPRLVHAAALPGKPGAEPRGAIWVSIELSGWTVDVVNTHLGLRHADRSVQVEELLGPEWIGKASGERPLVLAGDFNAGRRSRTYRFIRRKVRDPSSCGLNIGATFPSRFPVLRLDHVFLSGALRATAAGVVRTPLTRVASDHLPIFVDFERA